MRRHLLIAIIIPLFFVGFALGYRPLEIMSTCDLGHFAPYIHVVLLGCIILCVLLISRAIYFVIEHFTERLKWWEDIIRCVSELLVSALFMAMYKSHIAHTLYYKCLPTTIQYVPLKHRKILRRAQEPEAGGILAFCPVHKGRRQLRKNQLYRVR